MNFNFSGVSTHQRNLVNAAIAACAYPLDDLEVDVTVTNGTPPPDDIMFTQASADGATIEIATWADDPTASQNAGLTNPVAEVPRVFMEDFVHEIGHVVSWVTFITGAESDSIEGMCELFGRLDSDGTFIQGHLLDFDSFTGPWALKIKEAVAECFKCAFYTGGGPLVFGNRTEWSISKENWPTFLFFLEPVDVVTGVVCTFAGHSETVMFARPMSIRGRPAVSSAEASGRLFVSVCGSPEDPASILQEDLIQVAGIEQAANGTWVFRDYLLEQFQQELDGITTCPFTVNHVVKGSAQFPGFGILRGVGGSISGVDEGGSNSGTAWQIFLTISLGIPSTGDSLFIGFDIGYNEHSPFEAVRGVDIHTHIQGADEHADFADFLGDSLTPAAGMGCQVQLLVVQLPISADYPFVPTIPLIPGRAVPGPAATGLQLVERG